VLIRKGPSLFKTQRKKSSFKKTVGEQNWEVGKGHSYMGRIGLGGQQGRRKDSGEGTERIFLLTRKLMESGKQASEKLLPGGGREILSHRRSCGERKTYMEKRKPPDKGKKDFKRKESLPQAGGKKKKST